MATRVPESAVIFRVSRAKETEGQELLRQILEKHSEDSDAVVEPTFESIFGTIGWEVRRDKFRNLIGLIPALHDSPHIEPILEALGPLVMSGSLVSLRDEHGKVRTWVFDGKRCFSDTEFEAAEMKDILGERGYAIYQDGPLPPRDTIAPIDPILPPPVLSIRCSHPKFGSGTIVRILEGKAEVHFDSGEQKTLLRSFLKES